MSNQKIRNDLKEILNISKPKIICKMNNSCREEAWYCLNLAQQILISECEKKKPSLWNVLQRKNWKLSCDSSELKRVLSEVFETCEVRLPEFPEPQIDVEEFVDQLYTHIDRTLEFICETNDIETSTFGGDVSEGKLEEYVQEINAEKQQGEFLRTENGDSEYVSRENLEECVQEINVENQQGEPSRLADEDSEYEMNLNESTLNQNCDILDSLMSLQKIGHLEREVSQERSLLDENEKLVSEAQNNDEFEQKNSCGSETAGPNLRPRTDDENLTSSLAEEVRQEEIIGFRDEHTSLPKSSNGEVKATRVMQLGRQTYAQKEANKLENLRIKKARAEATKQKLDASIRNRCIQIASERERRQKQAALRRQQAEEERIRRIIMRSKVNHYQMDKSF